MTHAATFTLQAANKPVTEDTAYDDNEAKWRAVLSRDARADGSFYFSVLTTGVYCRPSCGARTPKRENVDFHTCPEAAEKAASAPANAAARLKARLGRSGKPLSPAPAALSKTRKARLCLRTSPPMWG